MPHTNKKKNKNANSKRILVVDDDSGWTRVTKQSNTTSPTNPTPTTTVLNRHLTIPSDASVAQTVTRYKTFAQRWLASESWTVLRSALTSKLDSITHSGTVLVSTCILFGSGSPTAHGQGWIDRHHVALTQIAVFRSVVDLITTTQQQQQQQQQQQHPPPTVYAQEPDYNDIDIEFLRSLGIETVSHPVGFELLLPSSSPTALSSNSNSNSNSISNSNSNSFVYAPGAEASVAMRAISAQPVLYLGHELDHYSNHHDNHHNADENPTGDGTSETQDKTTIQRFKADHSVIAIPDLDGVQDYPFHQQRLYYRE